MRVLWACVCVCVCLAGTVAGKRAKEEKEALDMIKTAMERQEIDSSFARDDTMESSLDTTTTTSTSIDSLMSLDTDITDSTTTPDTSTASGTSTSSSSTATTITTSITTITSEPMTTSSPPMTGSPLTTSSPPMTGSPLPVDCTDLLLAGVTTSGVYDIFPFTCTCRKPVTVWCDMETDGGGWTVFLNRQRQTEQLDFNRTWEEYKEGFGDPYQEHWLGLQTLHVMTYGRTYSLRLDANAGGVDEYATRAIIKVEPEDNRYRILTSGSESGNSNSRNCLRYMNYRAFTTFDQDNNNYYTGNCATVQGGGWWYHNCRSFNPTSTYGTALNLTCPSSPPRNVTRLQLKIRPALCNSSVKTIHLQESNCGC